MLRSLSDQFDKENIIWKLEKTRKGLVFSVGDLECDGKIFGELSSHLSSHEKNNVTIPDTEKPYLYKRMNNKKIDIRQIEKEVDQNIDLDILYEQYPDQNDQKTIQNMRQIILDTMELEQDKVRLGNDIYPTEKVQKRLMKIKTEHIAYILNNLESLEHPIRNINAYLLKSLFTAPVSFNFNKYVSKKSIEDLPDWYADTKQQEASPELLAEVQQLLNEIINFRNENKMKARRYGKDLEKAFYEKYTDSLHRSAALGHDFCFWKPLYSDPEPGRTGGGLRRF